MLIISDFLQNNLRLVTACSNSLITGKLTCSPLETERETTEGRMNERTSKKRNSHWSCFNCHHSSESLLQTTLQFGIAVDNPEFTTSCISCWRNCRNTRSAAVMLLHTFVSAAIRCELGGPVLELLVG